MNKNQEERIFYKKKYEKDLHHYIALMLMADIFDLEKSSRQLLFSILDEGPLAEWQWEKFLDRSRRIRTLFSEHPFYSFPSEYPTVLRAALGKIKIMSN